jgi:hypothetical protein
MVRKKEVKAGANWGEREERGLGCRLPLQTCKDAGNREVGLNPPLKVAVACARNPPPTTIWPSLRAATPPLARHRDPLRRRASSGLSPRPRLGARAHPGWSRREERSGRRLGAGVGRRRREREETRAQIFSRIEI